MRGRLIIWIGKKAILALITFKLYNLVQSQAGFIFQETGETGKEVWVFNMMFGKDGIIGDMCQELNDWQLRYANSIAPSTSKFIKVMGYSLWRSTPHVHKWFSMDFELTQLVLSSIFLPNQ